MNLWRSNYTLVVKTLSKFEQRATARNQWRKDLREKGREIFIAGIVPTVLTKGERQAKAKELREKAKKSEGEAKQRPSRKLRKSRKFRASAKSKPALSLKPSLERKPCRLTMSLRKKALGLIQKRPLGRGSHKKLQLLERLATNVTHLAAFAQAKGVGEQVRVSTKMTQIARSKSLQALATPEKSSSSTAAPSPDPSSSSTSLPLDKALVAVVASAQNKLLQLEVLELRAQGEAAKVAGNHEANQQLAATLAQKRKKQEKLVTDFVAEASSIGPLLEEVAEQANQLGPPPLPPPAGEVPEWLQSLADDVVAEAASEPAVPLASLAVAMPIEAAAAPASEAPVALYVVVANESAPEAVKGKRGTYLKTAGKFTFFKEFGLGERAKPVKVETLFVKFITELEAKRSYAAHTLNIGYVKPSLAVSIYAQMCFKPAKLLRNSDEQLCQDHIDAGTAEILWRLLPGIGFVVLPAGLTHFLFSTLHLHSPAACSVHEGKALYGEENEAVIMLRQKVARGRVTVIPIFSGTHWTLMTIERVMPASQSVQTSAINHLGSHDIGQRGEAELLQFDTGLMPEIEGKEASWKVRYYETLDKPRELCMSQAKWLLAFLALPGLADTLPARHNSLRQAGATCGLWILHYVEEEARAYMGERPGTMKVDLEHRKNRCNAMIGKLAEKAGKDGCAASLLSSDSNSD